MSVEIETYLKQLAANARLPYEEVKKLYEKYYATLKDLPPQIAAARARLLTYREIKSLVRYPGRQAFDVLWLGFNAGMDAFARRRQQALELYSRDPVAAFQQGFVDANGKPIFRFPSGRTIDISQPVMLRQSVGIGRPATGGPLKWVVALHRGSLAEKLPPLKKTTRCVFNKAGETETVYAVNVVDSTKFEPIQMPEFGEVDDAKIFELLQKAPEQSRVTCATIRDWHVRNAGNVRRVCVLEGDVMTMRMEPTAVGNYLMIVEDETLYGAAPSLEAEGVTVWIHQQIAHMMDFGEGSRVIVVGRTTQMPGYDLQTRTIDRSVTRIGINAFGVYAHPQFRVAPEEVEVFEEVE